MSDSCEWCEGHDGWPPASKTGLCMECRIEWERDTAVAILRRLMSHDVIAYAEDRGPVGAGYPSDELSRDKSAAVAFLDEMGAK